MTSLMKKRQPASSSLTAPTMTSGFTKLAVVACATLALAGCRELVDNKPLAKGWTVVDHNERHPILVSKKPANLNLSIPRGAHGLSHRQRARVIDFLSRYRAQDAGNSRISIKAPSGAPNEVSSMHGVHEIRRLITEQGFNGTNVVVEAYDDPDHPHPPVRLSYLRYVAEGPECGHWNKNIGVSPRNLDYPDLGCANQRNFAAQIANPADLVGPRTMTPRDNAGRIIRLDKWRKGESTASARGEDERARTDQ